MPEAWHDGPAEPSEAELREWDRRVDSSGNREVPWPFCCGVPMTSTERGWVCNQDEHDAPKSLLNGAFRGTIGVGNEVLRATAVTVPGAGQPLVQGASDAEG